MIVFRGAIYTVFLKKQAGIEMIRYQKNRLVLANDSKELLEKEAGGLPFVCNFNESNVFIGNHIPWHWHDWFEINYTERGSYILQTPEQTLEIHQGEAVFINGNILHAYDFPADGGYYSLSCDARFPGGEFGSYLDRKYFSPLLRSRSLTVLHIKPDSERRISLIGYILKILNLLREEPKGYELTVRQIIGDFLILLTEEAAVILARDQAGNGRDLERMKLMLDYVYKNYAEQIGVTEIARAASVSTRECTRCFKRMVDRTPVRFLIEYRAQMAASLLLGTGHSISEIAEKCGFMSDSYFSKIFREIYKCTPREYRKAN